MSRLMGRKAKDGQLDDPKTRGQIRAKEKRLGRRMTADEIRRYKRLLVEAGPTQVPYPRSHFQQEYEDN